MPTNIEWCEETWNPITGCSHAGSPGCDHCYAKRMAQRLKGRYGYPKEDPFKVTFHPDRLEQPLKWKKPKRIFVCSMSDLFHEDVTDKQIDQIFAIMTHPMSGMDHHTYLILTKRPERILTGHAGRFLHWPNIWLGATVESSSYLHRIDALRNIPAQIKFISFEPLLESVPDVDLSGINWVICGGESGPGARPMHPDWARSIRDQCQAAGVNFFFKQWGEWAPMNQVGAYAARGVFKGSNHTGRFILSYYDNAKLKPADSYLFDDESVFKVGKKKAGRILDGRTWNVYPEKI